MLSALSKSVFRMLVLLNHVLQPGREHSPQRERHRRHRPSFQGLPRTVHTCSLSLAVSGKFSNSLKCSCAVPTALPCVPGGHQPRLSLRPWPRARGTNSHHTSTHTEVTHFVTKVVTQMLVCICYTPYYTPVTHHIRHCVTHFNGP